MKTLHTAAVQFTPGPWRIGKYGKILTPNGETLLVDGVSIPLGNHSDIKEAEANARLIASAPELLEALQDMCNAYAGTGEQSSAEKSQQAYHRALMLVTKATGGNL